MKKMLLVLLSGLCIAFPATRAESATSLWFDPLSQMYGPADAVYLDLRANIDEVDAIYGFGFDLSFDGGGTYISSPGDSGSYLTFVSFTPNSTYFQYDLLFPPLWDDGDSIAGEVPLGEPDVWGSNILLGTLAFDAPASEPFGTESFFLGPPAGDYGIFGEEGLLGATAFMPDNPEADTNPVPIPTAAWLLGSGLIGLMALRRRYWNVFP